MCRVVNITGILGHYKTDMDKKSEVVHAVRVTNAKIDSSMEIDPDAIAASADFFCYSGGTAKVHVIGQKEYQVSRLNLFHSSKISLHR